MKLIKFEDYQIKISDEAYLIKPIRDLFNKDKSKGKEKFFTQMSLVYFLKDPRSNYSYIADEEEKYRMILKQEGLPDDYKISKELLDIMELYEVITKTTSTTLLSNTRSAINKVSDYLKDIDMNAIDNNGKPIYDPNRIVATIEKVPKLIKTLIETEKIVESEIQEQAKARGSQELTVLDNGFDIFK